MADGKKKEGRCVQTENNRKMCKHIKDKKITFWPTTPFAPKRSKKSAKKRLSIAQPSIIIS